MPKASPGPHHRCLTRPVASPSSASLPALQGIRGTVSTIGPLVLTTSFPASTSLVPSCHLRPWMCVHFLASIHRALPLPTFHLSTPLQLIVPNHLLTLVALLLCAPRMTHCLPSLSVFNQNPFLSAAFSKCYLLTFCPCFSSAQKKTTHTFCCLYLIPLHLCFSLLFFIPCLSKINTKFFGGRTWL